MQSLLLRKQSEEDQKMKLMVEMLKSKGNKKCNFRLMRHVDKDKLMDSIVDHYKLKEFRPHVSSQQQRTSNPAFAVAN